VSGIHISDVCDVGHGHNLSQVGVAAYRGLLGQELRC